MPGEQNRRKSRISQWRVAKFAVVGVARLRDIHLVNAKKPSNARKAARRAQHFLGIDAAKKVVKQVRGKDTKECLDYLRAFLAGSELEMSAHIERAKAMIEALKWNSEDGRVPDITADEVYGNVERSMMIFDQLYAKKDKFDHSQLTLLKHIKERARAYSAAGLKKPAPLMVVVLGGGPVGLRTACEMALLGHKVTVLECRDRCSRLNVLKLWEETTIDLDRLGLKGVDADYANKKAHRASTARLQLALLKAALLLGVQVSVDRAHEKDFELSKADGADVLFIATGYREELYAKLRKQATVARYAAAASPAEPADATDAAEAAEAFPPMPEGRAPAAAIAVVAHFARGGKEEQQKAWARTFEPFDWTVQDAKGADRDLQLREMQQRYGMFCIAPKALAAEGIRLENIVCYANKGKAPFTAVPPSYYFIFTLKSEMLTACRDDAAVPWKLIKPDAAAGMPAEGGSRALLEWAKGKAARDAGAGVDQAELDRFVKRVVTLFTEGYVAKGGVKAALPATCPLLRDTVDGFHRSIDIFDFSERHSMRLAAEVVTAVAGADGGAPQKLEAPLLVLPVGDALQEPFWPEGLGINRGMHNALDSCWAANQWGQARDEPAAAAELVQRRQSLYESKTLQMHGKNRMMLRGYRSDNSKGDSPKPAHHYSPDPASRYNAPLFGSG